MVLLSAGVSTDMSTWMTALTSVFTSLFQSAWSLVTGNWFLMASVGIPLVGGLLFAIISFVKNR